MITMSFSIFSTVDEEAANFSKSELAAIPRYLLSSSHGMLWKVILTMFDSVFLIRSTKPPNFNLSVLLLYSVQNSTNLPGHCRVNQN